MGAAMAAQAEAEAEEGLGGLQNTQAGKQK